jgi:hypothetical protein
LSTSGEKVAEANLTGTSPRKLAGPAPYDDGSGFRPPPQPAVNLYPPNVILIRALTDLMSFLNWTSAAVLYEDDFGEEIAWN